MTRVIQGFTQIFHFSHDIRLTLTGRLYTVSQKKTCQLIFCSLLIKHELISIKVTLVSTLKVETFRYFLVKRRDPSFSSFVTIHSRYRRTDRRQTTYHDNNELCNAVAKFGYKMSTISTFTMENGCYTVRMYVCMSVVMRPDVSVCMSLSVTRCSCIHTTW